jgi:hypothetical protein
MRKLSFGRKAEPQKEIKPSPFMKEDKPAPFTLAKSKESPKP